MYFFVCICLSTLVEIDLEHTFFMLYKISALETRYFVLCFFFLDLCS